MAVRKIAVVFAAAALASLLVTSTAAVAAPAVDGHFTVPTFSLNNKIVAGPDGNMWLPVEDGGKDVARITPDGKVDSFALTGVAVPRGIAVDTEGRIWVTQSGGVASFLPSDPEGTSNATAIGAVKAEASIVQGPDGRMWVATEGKAVHFAPTKPTEPTSVNVPLLNAKDIDVAGSLLVIADANNQRIVTLTTAGEGIGIGLLGSTTTAQGVAGGPGGQIAFSKSDGTEGLGLVTPPAGPSAVEMAGDPFGVTLGSDGAYWFAMSAANNLQRLTVDGNATPLNGLPPKFFPRQIAPGPNNTLWVTMEIPGENVYEVARVSGVDPPKVPGGETKPTAPETKLDKGPKRKVRTRRKRARVRFLFSSTTPGVTFECALIKPTLKSKPPQFAIPGQRAAADYEACESPFKAKRKPGRYRFFVRAVNAGVPDPTPATRTFRVVRLPKKK